VSIAYLSGRGITVRQRGRVALVLLGAGVLLVFGAVSFVNRVGASQPLVGVQWAQASSGPFVVAVERASPAWSAGLRQGDRLISVNDKEAESVVAAAELGWQAESGGPIVLRIDRAGAERTLRFVPAWYPRTEPYTYLSIVGLAFWVSGLFIALRWPKIRGGVVYTMLAMALFAQLTLSHTGRADGLDWSIYWADLIAGAVVPALLLHLGIALSRRTLKRRRWVVNAAYAVAAATVLAAVWLSPAALGGAYRFTDPVNAVELRDRLEPLLFAISLALTVLLLAKSHRRSSSVLHRSQMRWLLWGLAVGLGPFVMLYAVPWALGAPALPSWAQLAAVVPMLVVPGAFTAALARYRPYDLDLFLLRGFFEVTAVFCAFAVYAVTVFLLREGLNELLDLSRSATRYIGLLVMAVAYPQLRSWVRSGVDRAFYRKRYSYRATLLDWARELNAETDLASLLSRLRTRVCETLGTPRAEVLVRTGVRRFSAIDTEQAPEPLDLDEAAIEHLGREPYLTLEGGNLAVVMKVKGRLRAVLAIAEREPPEEPLTTEDRALLGTLAAHAATAIEAARLVLEVRQRAEEIERLHARQARILQSSAVGLLLLDNEGRIQDWNRALEEIYGLPRD
jgi:PAS domain-containing protein